MSEHSSKNQTTLVSFYKSTIDWQQVCRVMLKQSISINPLMTNPSEGEPEKQQVQSSLGLVEPNKGKYRNIVQTQGQDQEDEIVQKYSQREFFEQILQQGKSKTKGRRIAIVGQAGTGKTTLLQKIADWILNNTEDIPIWISLGNIGKTPLRQYLQEKWLKRATKSADEPSVEWQNALEELLNSGRVWLLLDGVEHIPIEQVAKLPITLATTEARAMMLNSLSAIIQQLQGWTDKTRIILTSRDYVWSVDQNILSSFDVFYPLKLTYPEEVKQFISQWFSQNQTEKKSDQVLEKETAKIAEFSAENLLQALEQLGYQRIKDLLETPLRLAFICCLWQQKGGKLPTTKAGLYQQLVAQFYQWQAEKTGANANQQQQLNQALGKLALKAMDSELHPSWLYHHLLVQELGEDKGLLNLCLRLGWLKPIGVTTDKKPEKIYAFFDHAFLEYFAALAVEDWHFFLNHSLGMNENNPSQYLQNSYRVFEKRWQQVILLWLGREDLAKEEKEAFLQALIEFADGCDQENYYGKRTYFLAASGLAEFPNSQKTQEILNQLLEWSFFDKQVSPFIAEAAKIALMNTQRNKAIAALMQVLQSSHYHTIPKEIFNTIEKIGRGNSQAILLLTELLEKAPSDPLRWQIAESLGKIDPGNTKAISTIVRLLETTSSEEVRQIAFNSLDKIAQGNVKAISALIRLLHTSNSSQTQRQVFESIEKVGLGKATAIAALVQLIRTTQDESIRRQAAESLEKIDSGNPTAIAVLVQLAKSANSEEIRKQAIYSLGEITPGNGEAISALVDMLLTTNDVFICWIALSSLGKIGIGSQEAVNGLVKLIQSDEHKLLKKDAIENLGKIDPDNPEAITALVELMESTDDESIRREAAESLGKIDPGNPEAITALVQLLRNTEDEFTRRQVAYSLGKIDPGNLESLKTLIQLIQSSNDRDIRGLAAETLGDIGINNPAAIASLIRLIKSTNDSKALRRAAESLGKIGAGNREVMATLISMIKLVKDEAISLQAADSLIILLKPEQMAEMIRNLRESVSKPQKEQDLAIKKIIWYCAQELSYPQFYQAWHNSPLDESLPIIEDKEIAKNDNTPKNAERNWEGLPKALQNKLDEHSLLNQKVRLVFIDSNDLIDPENPLVDIYDLMLEQNCPEFGHGIPDTMAKLRLYWNTIQRNYSSQTVVLVFYENLADPDSQGFSPVFFKMLSKFSGSICLVTEQPSVRLKQFSPNDPNLIQNMINWIEKLVIS